MIQSFIGDKKAKQIKLEIPMETGTMDIEFSKSVLKAIEQSDKDLVLKAGDAVYTLEDEAVDELLSRTGNAVVTLSVAPSTNVKKALTDIYTIELLKGTAANKSAVKKFDEEIQVTIALDKKTEKLAKKASVLNINTNKNSKVKVKKGAAHFEIEAAGSYVLVK